MSRIAAIVLVTGAALVTATLVMACSAQSDAGASSTPAAASTSVGNGRAIFQTGRDFDGVQIVAQAKPLFGSCAACHHTDGSGGRKFSDGAVSADLRHQAIVIRQKHPYTLALLERAISTGIDNEGKPLDKVMPHWQLSKRDLHDVAQYVLVKLK